MTSSVDDDTSWLDITAEEVLQRDTQAGHPRIIKGNTGMEEAVDVSLIPG